MPETPPPVSPNDVARPGTTAPDATSKPVIVARGPIAPDPMMNNGQVAAKQEPVVEQSSGGSMKPKLSPTTPAPELKKKAVEEEDKKHAETPIGDQKKNQVDVQSRLGEIIESGEYNVSIKQSRTRSTKTFIITVLGVVLVGFVVVYLLIDLKVIDAGIKLPIEFFK